MCQGVIVSLVKFKRGRQTKSVILKGVGSHSELVQDNLAKLTKAGWKDDLPGQKVFSVESNFSAWNKFTLVSGKPDKKELKILAKAYREIAGNPSALIRHVLKYNMVDYALVALLTAQALAEYDKVTAAAGAEYDKVIAAAWVDIFRVKSNRIKCLQ